MYLQCLFTLLRTRKDIESFGKDRNFENADEKWHFFKVRKFQEDLENQKISKLFVASSAFYIHKPVYKIKFKSRDNSSEHQHFGVDGVTDTCLPFFQHSGIELKFNLYKNK